MSDPELLFDAVRHGIAVAVRPGSRHCADATRSDDRLRDRGAVSIEQVLWYAAAAVSVAVVATIIWTQIKSTAGTGVNTPSAP